MFIGLLASFLIFEVILSFAYLVPRKHPCEARRSPVFRWCQLAVCLGTRLSTLPPSYFPQPPNFNVHFGLAVLRLPIALIIVPLST